MMWARGDQIALRCRWGDKLAWVDPVTVVEDSPRCIALSMAIGTPIKMPCGEGGQPTSRWQLYETGRDFTWRLKDDVWRMGGT